MGHEITSPNEEGRCILELGIELRWVSAPSVESLYNSSNLIEFSEIVKQAAEQTLNSTTDNHQYCLIQFRLDEPDEFHKMLRHLKKVISSNRSSKRKVNSGYGFNVRFSSNQNALFNSPLEESRATIIERRNRLSVNCKKVKRRSVSEVVENEFTHPEKGQENSLFEISVKPDSKIEELDAAITKLVSMKARRELNDLFATLGFEGQEFSGINSVIDKIDDDLDLGIELTHHLLCRHDESSRSLSLARVEFENKALSALAGRKLSVDQSTALIDQLEITAQMLGLGILFRGCRVKISVKPSGVLKIQEIGKPNEKRLSTSKSRFPLLSLG